jgi:hypothetical protein
MSESKRFVSVGILSASVCRGVVFVEITGYSGGFSAVYVTHLCIMEYERKCGMVKRALEMKDSFKLAEKYMALTLKFNENNSVNHNLRKVWLSRPSILVCSFRILTFLVVQCVH